MEQSLLQLVLVGGGVEQSLLRLVLVGGGGWSRVCYD